MVIAFWARIFPSACVPDPIVTLVGPATCQKIFSAFAPFFNCIREPEFIVRSPATWKIQTAFPSPFASKVRTVDAGMSTPVDHL